VSSQTIDILLFIVGTGVAIGGALVGFAVKRVFVRMDAQDEDIKNAQADMDRIGSKLGQFQIHVAGHYVPRAEHREEMRELSKQIADGFNKLEARIEGLSAKLDQKADK